MGKGSGGAGGYVTRNHSTQALIPAILTSTRHDHNNMGGGGGGGRERERERENSSSKTLILKDSRVRSIWTCLIASPCYATNTNKHDNTTNKYYEHDEAIDCCSFIVPTNVQKRQKGERKRE